MPLSPEQATHALRDIETAESRSRELRGYQEASPHFILWGVIWVIGYGATGLWPEAAKWLWPALTACGAVAGVIIGRRRGQNSVVGRRIGLSILAAVIFMFATFAVLQPHGLNPSNAFPALLTALGYALAGIWARPRYLWLAAGVATATLFGFFYLAPWFSFWMAAVGGGGLILGGLWMRKA